MHTELAFRLALALLLVSFVAHRGYYNRKLPPPEQETVDKLRAGPASILAGAIFLLALASALVYLLYPGLISWASLPLPAWLRWLGVGLAGAGFALLQWSHLALGRNWSDQPRITRGQQLVQTGPYRWIRHPMYTSFLLILGSTLLITANWLAGGLWIAATGLDAAHRIRYEERAMRLRFGEAYRDYQRRTGRLTPRL
jgi:protein-S-isoprenylcysteine O-methyltransferase Ste14